MHEHHGGGHHMHHAHHMHGMFFMTLMLLKDPVKIFLLIVVIRLCWS